MDKKDNNREGVTMDKVIQLFRLFVPKNNRTLAHLDRFSDLNVQKLSKLAGITIKGVIVDVDDCIAPLHGKILPENLAHIQKLIAQGIKVLIYSNMKYTSRYETLPKGANVLTNVSAKPSIKGFKKALEEIGLKSHEAIMVGDNYFSDGGSTRIGIPFVHIDPVNKSGAEKFRLMAALRKFYIWYSKICDFFRKEKAITSKDLKEKPTSPVGVRTIFTAEVKSPETCI